MDQQNMNSNQHAQVPALKGLIAAYSSLLAQCLAIHHTPNAALYIYTYILFPIPTRSNPCQPVRLSCVGPESHVQIRQIDIVPVDAEELKPIEMG